jgi:hypothetical protein
MSFDPIWGVPVVAIVVAAAGWAWAYLSDKAFTRKFGPR